MNPQELDKLIAEATADFQKKTADILTKSIGQDSPDEDSQGSSEPADAAPADEAPKAPPAGEPDGDEAPAPAAAAPAPAAPGEGDIMAAPTVEELAAEYSNLPDDQLDMHIQAAQMAKAAKAAPVAAAMAPAPVAPAPAPAPMAPPAAPPAADPMLALKSEFVAMLQAKDAEIEAQKAELAKAERIFKNYIESQVAPVRKAVTAASEVAPPVAKPDFSKLSKAEISTMLCSKLREGKLTKTEGNLVASFAIGTVSFKDVEALLLK